MKKLVYVLAACSVAWVPLDAAVLTFSNPSSISLNEPSTVHTAPTVAAPYPSTIAISGVTDPISKIRVTLSNINNNRPDDMEILLVSPTGVKFVILSDAGGAATPAIGVSITLDDAGATQVPDAGPLTTGTFQPTCVDSANNIDTGFPAPAPAGPYNKPAPRGTATFASAFSGINVNGTWSLYAVDDNVNSPQTASITGGWSIEITTAPSQAPTTTTLSSLPNPSFTTAPSNAVVFNALVVKQTDSTPVTVGNVTFREGATVLMANVALNGSGRAFYTNTTFPEGPHTISATYNGDAAFLTSSGNTTQNVDNHTVVMGGNTFCNTGTVVFADAIAPGPANVYPSHIFVSGLAGNISKVTVQVKVLSHARPDDIDLLLVSPTGTKFILLSDAGGTTTTGGATLTFDDAAASFVPDAGPITTGTYRPSSYTPADTFPAPAPTGPYLTPSPEGGDTLAAFNGANPNGTWSLYVVDDIANAGQVNTIANGWCLAFTTSGDAPTFTTLTSSLNPALVGQSVTLTAAVKRASNSNAVTSGTVTFREAGNILASAVALNGSGMATFATSSLTEGNHVITADYSGVAGSFNVSSAVVTQRVDNATVVSSNRYSNPGAITIPADGLPPVYPSRILVTNAGSVISNIIVDIGGINIDRPDDLELLLVSPSGAHLVLLSDAGGTVTPASGVSITFSDAAGSFIADSGPLTSGTFKPTSISATATFPPPAPGASYNHPGPAGSATLASIFGGTNPNGYWSLYVVDDVIGGGGVIGSGWSISLLGPPAVTCPANILTTNALGQCQSAPVSFTAIGSGGPPPAITYRIGATPITSPYTFPIGMTTVSVLASNAYGTATCSFTVTVLAASVPMLSITRASTNVVVSWPSSFNCYTLQSAPGLVLPPATNAWINYSGAFTTNAGRIYVTNNASSGKGFYRLFY